MRCVDDKTGWDEAAFFVETNSKGGETAKYFLQLSKMRLAGAKIVGLKEEESNFNLVR